jgi:hypothetical protein
MSPARAEAGKNLKTAVVHKKLASANSKAVVIRQASRGKGILSAFSRNKFGYSLSIFFAVRAFLSKQSFFPSERGQSCRIGLGDLVLHRWAPAPPGGSVLRGGRRWVVLIV